MRKPKPRYFVVGLELNGYRWSGRGEVLDGVVKVCSVYGSGERAHGDRRPEDVAQEVLVEVLRAKLAELEAKNSGD